MRNLKFVWNIPNVLSLVRLALLPVFAVLYLKGFTYGALIVLVVSGITDLLDGMIARKFNQITEFGKLFDPIADKITQVTVLVCLTVKNLALIPLVIICFITETLQLIGGWILLSHNEVIRGAKWFGKVSTFTFYIAMLIIAFWKPLSRELMLVLITLVSVAMAFSFFMYMGVYLKIRREKLQEKK